MSWLESRPDVKLFISRAGKAAFDTLNSGRELKIRGSMGTNYYMNTKSGAYYCVRDDHWTSYCAVVPSVAYWDHFLGLKLWIEHDEPTFLLTASFSPKFDLVFPTLSRRMRLAREIQRREKRIAALTPKLNLPTRTLRQILYRDLVVAFT